MQPRMSQKETDVFLHFLKCSDSYVEFGAGGSTVAASKYVKKRVISLDSSVEWLDNVRNACAGNSIDPELYHIDLGSIGEWGYPTDHNTKHKWPEYYEFIWTVDGSCDADLYIIDGRFRVASFAQAVLHCRSDSIICFHDFASRPQYRCVYDLAREILAVEDISFFIIKPNVRDRAYEIIKEHRFNAQ
jgi:hypothetical protein